MKKKIFGTMIWSLLILGFAGTVQAEETEVNYSVENSYTLVIPAQIDLNSAVNSIEIGAANYNIEPTSRLKIFLSEENESIIGSSAIKLTREKDVSGHSLFTGLVVEDDPSVLFEKGDLLFEAAGQSDVENLKEITFAPLSGVQKAGDYKTRITFTAGVF